MKKIASILIACFMGHLLFSQPASIPASLRNLSVKTEAEKAVSDISEMNMPINSNNRQNLIAPNETIVGRTYYDLHTNSALSNRIAMHPDGTIGGVWIYGMTPTAFPERGTGYNFYDGSNWGPEPSARIESVRSGWPSYDTWGTNGEINVAHNGATGLQINKRENRGTGSWTESLYANPGGVSASWPRLVTSGTDNDYIHMVFNSNAVYNGQNLALLYSRSNDGGASWSPQNIVLTGTGSSYYKEIGADDYTMAARGDNVAILYSSAWSDLFVMKSTDNGSNWSKIVIWNHPYPMFDFNVTITDTLFCVDESASVAIAPDGKVHVVFGINRVLHNVVGTSFNSYPYVDGIGYWNEDMPAFSDDLNALAPPQYGYPTSEMIEDYNYIGWTQDMDGDGKITFIDTPIGFPLSYRSFGLSTMPTISVDDNGNIFIAYASTTETYDNSSYNYKKIWMRSDSAGSWGDFYHATSDPGHDSDESIYPVLAQSSNDNVYLIYQADETPGVALDGDHAYQENRIIVSEIPKSDLITIDDDPDIDVIPMSMTIYQSADSNDTLTINNIGVSALTVESITVDKTWILTSGYPTTPFTIDPGSSQEVIVEIDWPQLQGSTQTGNINIGSNDPDESVVTVAVTAVPLGMPDLIIQSENVVPANVEPGGSMNASCDVFNQGTADADSSNLKYYLSANCNYDNGDLELGSDALDSLKSGQLSSQNATLIIPENTASGSWFILFFADADLQVVESNEDNNVNCFQIEVQAVWPDLVLENQIVDPIIVLPGGTVDAECDVMNQGDVDAGISFLKYYLSTDTTYNNDDLELGSDSIGILGAGESISQNENLVIPANTTAGSWFILFYADAGNQVEESDENNNINFVQITVDTTTIIGPDQALTDFMVKVYPNPARSILFIDLSGLEEKPLTIEMINTLGIIISSFKYSATHPEIISLNTNQLPAGIYLLRIKQGPEIIYKRVMISG